jgi:hypothetical protein
VYVINSETGDGERIENRENSDKSTIDAQIRAPFCAQEGLVYIQGEDNWIYVVDVDMGKSDKVFDLTIEE